MAARPGEDVAAVLFADVHYYYGPPTAKPPHHRFDKGSYVYLFENAAQRRARIEIANNPGTAGQDAFNGYLDRTHVEYSYKQPNLVTVTVDGQTGPQSTSADAQEWHLPHFDPQNQKKYMYKLHTVDMYFWTKEDALQFFNGIRRVLSEQQIAVQGEPLLPPPHQEEMSPIVQKLENVAITDPSYQGGKTRDSRTSSFPGPPGPPISATPHSQEASNFVPMAYNPAAPAAPEVIAHREKTPPPEDGAGNPLMAAAISDHGQTFGVPHGGIGFSGPPGQPLPQQSYFTGPPASAPPVAAAPQSPFAQHFQHSFAPPPTSAPKSSPYAQPPPSSAPPPAYQQQTQPHVPVNQFANYSGSPGFPAASSSAPGVIPPPGGFANFQYTKRSNTQPLGTDYSIHQQVYRPTESEAAHGKTAKSGKTPQAAKTPRGKLEDRAEKLEKGVGSLLKKLEKKIG